MNEVRERIVKVIYDVCYPEHPNLEDSSAPLIGSDLDSLDFASILMAVEDEFNIVIDQDSIAQVGTLDGLVAFVSARSD